MAGKPRRNGTSTRKLVVARALALTANGGPYAATIGTLAEALEMSKSGVFALFGSKDALDLAVVDAAEERFARAVVSPADAAPRGVARLAAFVEGWLDEVEAASPALAVLEPGRPGAPPPMRERLRAWRDAWRATLAAEVTEARRTGELSPGTNAAQAAFEIDALLAAAARDGAAGVPAAGAARRAIEIRLRQLAAER